MTSVMEDGDEDRMEDEAELVRTLHGKNQIGKYHPIFFGRIDHRFPFYFAPNRQRFVKFKIEEPFRRWTIMAKPGKTVGKGWKRMRKRRGNQFRQFKIDPPIYQLRSPRLGTIG